MKIGFVDYYIAEWHANNYPAWFAAASKELGADVENRLRVGGKVRLAGL